MKRKRADFLAVVGRWLPRMPLGREQDRSCQNKRLQSFGGWITWFRCILRTVTYPPDKVIQPSNNCSLWSQQGMMPAVRTEAKCYCSSNRSKGDLLCFWQPGESEAIYLGRCFLIWTMSLCFAIELPATLFNLSKGTGLFLFVFLLFFFFFALSKVELFDDTIFSTTRRHCECPCVRWSLIAASSQDDWARPGQPWTRAKNLERFTNLRVILAQGPC